MTHSSDLKDKVKKIAVKITERFNKILGCIKLVTFAEFC